MKFARLLACLVFVGLAGYSFFLSEQDHAYQSVLATAVSLDEGEVVNPAWLDRAAAVVSSQSFSVDCRGDLLRPALTVLLHHLDTINIARDYDRWADGHTATQQYIQHMIECRPYDGNAWLRAAVVSAKIAEDLPSLKKKLAISRSLMPYEAEQVKSRLIFFKRISPYALTAFADIVNADLGAVLRYGSPQLKSTVGKDASPTFTRLLAAEQSKIASQATQ